MLAFVTGYTVFETISPTGILSRALIYGAGAALLWVVPCCCSSRSSSPAAPGAATSVRSG